LEVLEMSTVSKLPWWLPLVNRIIMPLNRLGLTLGTQHILAIPGRRSGKLRCTPVSLLTVDGERYVVAGFESDWVKNARAAGRALLIRGPRRERVVLTELPVEGRGPILREFPRQVPHGVQFFERLHGLPPDPEAFAAAAPILPVFRISRLRPSDNTDLPLPSLSVSRT
jgi:F420H(2)-dependent quinone reductase